MIGPLSYFIIRRFNKKNVSLFYNLMFNKVISITSTYFFISTVVILSYYCDNVNFKLELIQTICFILFKICYVNMKYGYMNDEKLDLYRTRRLTAK